MSSVHNQHTELYTHVTSLADNMERLLERRKEFESRLDRQKKQLEAYEREMDKFNTVPLAAADVERQLDRSKVSYLLLVLLP